MKDLQLFMKEFQLKHNWQIKNGDYNKSKESLLMNQMLLTTEVAEIAEEFRKLFKLSENSPEDSRQEAFEHTKSLITEDLGKEIADCLAYLIKFANYFNIDIEESFYNKMDEIDKRMEK
ncbi:hypothetical protein [Priestia aryabhattai]|uniref:hypothetical protein n=1 Tax=Priestia aryabhattai TaxID=412384 RepID=UPI001CDFE950|nr:hypothetical protein [Bacillus sp. T_4]